MSALYETSEAQPVPAVAPEGEGNTPETNRQELQVNSPVLVSGLNPVFNNQGELVGYEDALVQGTYAGPVEGTREGSYAAGKFGHVTIAKRNGTVEHKIYPMRAIHSAPVVEAGARQAPSPSSGSFPDDPDRHGAPTEVLPFPAGGHQRL